MYQLTRIVFCSLLFAAAGEASAQVAVTLDKDDYINGGDMLVTVSLSSGQSVSKPRFHFIADGAQLPRKSSTHWIDFPAFAMTQQVRLHAPDAVERNESAAWWLLLFDGDRLVARLPFDLLGWMLALELKRKELEAQVSGSGGNPMPSEPGSGNGTAMPLPATTDGVSSLKGYIQMSSQEPLMGEVFTVTVTLPASSPGDPGSASLRWGETENLPWDEKEKVPELGDSISAEIPGSAAGPQSISVTAPFSRPGRYELRLFRGQRLLDVLTVSVGG